MHHITLYKQVHPCQCQNLAKLGYKTLINLRFDDESDNQPKSQNFIEDCRHHQLNYHHLPINDDNFNATTIAQFAQLIHQSQKPIMVFCATGGRAKRLYQSAKINQLL